MSAVGRPVVVQNVLTKLLGKTRRGVNAVEGKRTIYHCRGSFPVGTLQELMDSVSEGVVAGEESATVATEPRCIMEKAR